MPANSTDQPAPQSVNAYTGRIVALVTLLLGLVGAAAPVVGNLDVSSTAGIVAGIAALTAIAVKYLEGWQRYEGRVDALQLAGLTPAAATAPDGIDDPVGGASAEPAATAVPVTVERSAAPVADATAAVDPDEPPAPRPGEAFDPAEPLADGEPADIPSPPDDDEIDAVTTDRVPVVAAAPPPAKRSANGRPPVAPAVP
jgi:hypothetical protein